MRRRRQGECAEKGEPRYSGQHPGRAHQPAPRAGEARRPAGRPAADAVDGDGWPPRRDGRRSGGDGGRRCSRNRGAVMASALGTVHQDVACCHVDSCLPLPPTTIGSPSCNLNRVLPRRAVKQECGSVVRTGNSKCVATVESMPRMYCSYAIFRIESQNRSGWRENTPPMLSKSLLDRPCRVTDERWLSYANDVLVFVYQCRPTGASAARRLHWLRRHQPACRRRVWCVMA